MEAHPYADIFPMLSDKKLADLAADILEHGQREPVRVFEGKILDGRNRYRACLLAEVEPKTEDFEGTKEESLRYVLSMNLHRRHLTDSQRAMVAARVADVRHGGDRGNQHTRGKSPIGDLPDSDSDSVATTTRREAAEALRVGTSSVDRASVILKSNDPALIEAVDKGEKTVNQAVREMQNRKRTEELKARAEKAEPSSAKWEVLHGDVIETLRKVPDNSVDLVFTDPPYNIGVDYGQGKKADAIRDEEFRDWCASWLTLCRDKLKSHGSLWLLINDEHAAELCVTLKRIGLHLRSWVIWYETFGVNCGNKFNRTKRHLLYTVRDPKRFTFNAEAVTRPSDRQAKYNDPRAVEGGKLWDDVWTIPRLVGNADERIPDAPTQLPLALVLPVVGSTSNEGDRVMDPFCGTGTTGVASVVSRREFLGIEREGRFVEIATLRMKGVSHGQEA